MHRGASRPWPAGADSRTGGAKGSPVASVLSLKAGVALYVGDGRGADALKGFERRLKRYRKRIRHVCMDMSGACAKRALAFLPDTETTRSL